MDIFRRIRPRSARFVWSVSVGVALLYLGWTAVRLLAQPAWIGRLPLTAVELLNLGQAACGFTLLVVWAALWWRQRAKRSRPMPALRVAELYALQPGEFEEYVAAVFRRKGYRVKVTGGSGDHGVDVALQHPDGRRAIVQCKRYQNTVGEETVRELYGTLIHEEVAHAFLVTTAEISPAAREWAADKPITLIDGETLARLTAAGASGRADSRSN
ncbi:MAG: restriction endonuclease [Chloroflexota bacterium]